MHAQQTQLPFLPFSPFSACDYSHTPVSEERRKQKSGPLPSVTVFAGTSRPLSRSTPATAVAQRPRAVEWMLMKNGRRPNIEKQSQ